MNRLDDKWMTATAEGIVQKSGVVPWSRGGWYRGLPARSASGRVLDAINFLQTPQHVAPPRAMKALLGGADVSSVDLAAYGVEVLLEGK